MTLGLYSPYAIAALGFAQAYKHMKSSNVTHGTNFCNHALVKSVKLIGDRIVILTNKGKEYDMSLEEMSWELNENEPKLGTAIVIKNLSQEKENKFILVINDNDNILIDRKIIFWFCSQKCNYIY